MQNQHNQIITVGKIYKVADRKAPKFIGKKGIRESKYYWAKVTDISKGGQRLELQPLNQEYIPPTAWDQKNETEFSDGSVEIKFDEVPFDMPGFPGWQLRAPTTIIEEVPMTHKVSISDFNNLYSDEYRTRGIPKLDIERFNIAMAEERRAQRLAEFTKFLNNEDEIDDDEDDYEPEAVFEEIHDEN